MSLKERMAQIKSEFSEKKTF
ncbi:MAG: hypothetical protein GPJ51_05070 [Candidatus Heimdallarchaeota archaeon]|nr:hypothetical protein [Candidatus Heimdallarchaeota archaeon]